jgi:pyruvate dehydrogenase E1 component
MTENLKENGIAEIENQEWLDSLEYVFQSEGADRVREILGRLQARAQEHGVSFQCPGNTPYINTIPADKQNPYPGNREIERRIKSIIRWNAMAMVVRANREKDGIGGHISTYASAATLFEVAFNHFIRGRKHEGGGDIVYFQGHASPGVYARAFLEGRLNEKDVQNFRRELKPGGGLSSYPHPWLMPGFWEFPTVSMGLAPVMAIYQARFNRYLEDRGLRDTSRQHVWAFLGDGEMDEPESMGAITLAAREELDNLLFVINCNLQRLDGPVRGNGKIVQELEAAFRGAGWNVIKVLWGSDWDPILARDRGGKLVDALNRVVDGEMQRYSVSGGAYIRERFFGQDPALQELVEGYSDEQLSRLRRGGHDPEKVFAAYEAAMNHHGSPTVILAHTIKGYGLGEAGEGRNVTHQQKKLNEEELQRFRSRFGIPISDEQVADAPFYKPAEESEEMRYLLEHRNNLGGSVPGRRVPEVSFEMPADEVFEEFYAGSEKRKVASTMVFVRLLSKLLQDKNMGKYVVPIVPDEARTFGMESLFRQVGIYSHAGQLYEPVDRESLLYYREAEDGVILEEGITEAGSMSSFIAAGTAYATHGVPAIPFFIFYSMFGFQRIGDLIWAAGDARARGFLVGGTSGRTTLAGEGLQHQDGHSHILAMTVPNLKAYDPAFAYEIAVIVRDGIERMYVRGEPLFYYLTVMNEFYPMPPMPEGAREGILRGMYRLRASRKRKFRGKVKLLGSGAIVREALSAAELLENEYEVAADVWSVTSYKELYLDAVNTERNNRMGTGKEQEKPFISTCLDDDDAMYVAATDYLRALPLTVSKWVPGRFEVLGTDGFGRSDGREELRAFFEIDARHMVLAALHGLKEEGVVDAKLVEKSMQELEIDTDKPDPTHA